MRTLLLTGSSARYMMPPQLGDEQITAGPDWRDERAPDGRWRSLQTPLGEYDLRSVLAKLPPEQQPDVIACLVDTSWRNLPHGFAAFRRPKVLLVADTHHLQTPLTRMLLFAATEPFDRIVFLYNRHHAALFRAAGFRNLFWFPGLTFPHDDATVHAARRVGARLPQLAFVGQAGNRHPRRERLLSALTAAKAPLKQRALGQREALPFYGASLLGFNASLNGDLNLRVFEILATGALLLTDRLSADSGLGDLLADGRDSAWYDGGAELVEKVSHWLARPGEAQAVAAEGMKWFDRVMNAAARRAMFRALAFDGRAPEPFPLPEPPLACFSFAGTRELLANVMIYEGVQELHRKEETVRVALAPGVPENFARLCATLPRVEVTRGENQPGADLFVTQASAAAAAVASQPARIWCWDASEQQLPELAGRLAPAGYARASDELAVFCRDETAPVEPTPDEQAAQARMHFERGDHKVALELGRTALERDHHCVGALAVLADLALLKEGGPLAEKLLRQARRLAPKEATLAAALAEALWLQQRYSDAEAAINDALRLNASDLRALLALARLRQSQRRTADAVKVLRQAVAFYPESSEAARQLGFALRRAGQVLEGLGWQRRSLGCAADIEPVDPAERPVRVAFLLQHPQGWTSLESVWRAMADDPAFETTIIAAPYDHPYLAEGGPDAIFAFLAKEKIPFVRWDEFPLEPGFADVLFVQNPYDVTRPAPLRVPNLLNLVPRLAYVPYGLEIGGGERNNTMVMDMPLQQFAWLLCARSERQRASYAQRCGSGNAHVAVTGHAKLDALRDLSAVDTAELDRFAAGRKLVGWNPHFDIRPKAGSVWGEGFSTFARWWEFLLAGFARRPGLALVIRPHPLFFGTLLSRQIWTQAQIDEFLRRAGAAGNILIDRHPSYLALFKRADAMLSDASSFVLEYGSTGKPLLYLHNPDGPGLNDDGDFVREHFYTAEREPELAAFLDMVEAGRDPRGAARRRIFPEYLHQPLEGVGAAVKRVVLDRLKREALQGTKAELVAS